MSNLKRVLSGGSPLAPAKKADPAARGFVKTSPLAAALSLGRIVLINVLALITTATATIHVFQRQHRPSPAAVDPQASYAISPESAPAALSAEASAPPIEVDFEQAAPAVTGRVPAAPSVNGMTAPDR